MGRGRTAVGRLLLLAISSAFALLVFEGALRIAAHRILHDGETMFLGDVFSIEDPLLGFSPIPNSSRIVVKGGAFLIKDEINSRGLRDVEHSLEKQPGAKRILVLGDSFMYGEGVRVQETMARRLEGLLDGVEVINAGVRGYDLGQEYLSYKHRNRSYGPDLVLLAFFINDLAPDSFLDAVDGADGVPLRYVTKPDYLARHTDRTAGASRGSLTAWLRSHSMLYVLLRDRWDEMVSRREERRAKPSIREQEPVPYVVAFRATPADGSIPEPWRRAYRILDALKGEVVADGAKLAIVMVPAPWQISEENWNQWVAWLGVEPTTLSRRHPQEMVQAWCSQTGTACHDLIPAFENGERARLYFRHEYHWSPEGHALAARAVADFLRSAGFP
ncbi:MAG: SGNH/GDSL hydrolase family protein [Acidobacteria bacterium]|nr:SGNH/GDSL hydrolase family protein [Acidobacteriota bacterium]